ncbi:uncharacterized protein LOC119834346 [Zerene cesonia]|uniref:uncharacterized protein LOC119834346 n=1 Tax=Zerene cesonia TaxID=33412 RepID=UPI0018E5827B|nr:uncharacterized protein LOC119834346 [Zerene cesonia]
MSKQLGSKDLNRSKLDKGMEPVGGNVKENKIHNFMEPFKQLDRNPFDIPWHKRVFTKCSKKRKIKPEPFIMDEPKSICDVDNEFYKIIEGRPIRSFTDIKVYMKTIRDILLTRANICYQTSDLILQMDNATSEELEEYNKVAKLYAHVKTSFIYFAQESYESAKQCQKLAEEKANLVDIAIEKLNDYCFVGNRLRNEIENLIAILKTLSQYGQFLYSIAPITWKELHHRNFARSRSVSTKLFATDMAMPSDELDYQLFIPLLKNDEPELYFKKPKEIVNVFDKMSKQCLNYMEMDVFTSNMLSKVCSRRDHLKDIVKYETDEMEAIIEMNKKQIHWLEQKEIEYKEKFNRILLNEFHNLFASYEVTKLFTCLQYVHTQIFATPEDPKDSISTLAYNLEMLYLNLTSKLDDLDQTIVKEAKRELFAEDIRIMKQARLAQRTLKECDILTKNLYTSFEPSRRRRK